jgi:hypothetical protein
MSINLLTRADTKNKATYTGLPQVEATKQELLQLVGATTSGAGIAVPSLYYFGFESCLNMPFYCKDGKLLVTNGSDALVGVYCNILPQNTETWIPVLVQQSGGEFLIDFNQVLPDHSRLIYKIQVTYVNLSLSSSTIWSMQLLSVDYPIDYDFEEFSVVASSHANSAIQVYNHSVQKNERDIRVLPVFSGDFVTDQVFMLTESGKEDTNRYHINRGINIPDVIPWAGGQFENTTVSGRDLSLAGTSTSGNWVSPVLFAEDDDYITMYVYTDDTSDQAIVDRDWESVNSLMEVRASNETPLPNFLILSWTKTLFTLLDISGNLKVDSLPTPDRRPDALASQSAPGLVDEYWNPGWAMTVCGYPTGIVSPTSYVCGRSKRLFVKGDGTEIQSSQDNYYEMASRAYWLGIPYKIFGDINSYWRAGVYYGLLTNDYGACSLPTAQRGHYDRITVGYEGGSVADWREGRSTSVYGLDQLYPHAYQGYGGTKYNLGCAQEPVPFENVGSTTIAMKRHPNEWAVITAEIFPAGKYGEDKFMSIFLLNIRNWWVSERKYLGSYGIGTDPCDEGYAVCASEFADSGEGGFWVHVGYETKIIEKYTIDGVKLGTYDVKRGYSYLTESKEEGGLWAIRNTGIYYYEESGNELVVKFKIEDSRFTYLQAGGLDDNNNLWVVDRDTSTVYRISYANREIDYTNYIPYVSGVWPHPTDGSAFIYVGFYPDTFSTAIKRVWANDSYNYEELVTPINSLPLSDLSGVQFKGKLDGSYISPGVNDPIWGTDTGITLDWESYANASLTMPAGKYKQFRLTLRRDSSDTAPPRVQKVRLPLSLILQQVPYESYKDVYINPHLRYNRKYGHFTTELVTWWPHNE